MAIKVSRLSHSTGQWRLWGGGQVEVTGTALGVFIEFTRKVSRGSATFQLAFDADGLEDLSAAVVASKSAASRTHAP